ncbi:TIR domain-containing protein [Dyadobacter sp. CY351]|uniref:TIR domain-containing protein n=1 Tax=Dyadobacter sp. CY351 TaxID=2909337 RepID=UPI001F1E1317|nr:TIR domain-containing protein [Dyadobacter sp. CY351]MCF2518535.1 TIR domain-containing protein [Dyadobacter sp. CY351]
MKIFFSWSGTKSREYAQALREMLELTFHGVDIWISDDDILAGDQWSKAIYENLNNSDFLVAFITNENIKAPWIQYESGMFSQKNGIESVCPYLIGVSPEDIGKSPISLFQALQGTREGTKKLIKTLRTKSQYSIKEDKLEKVFDQHWPELESKYENLNGKFQESEQLGYDLARLNNVMGDLRNNPIFSNVYIADATISYLQDFSKRLDRGVRSAFPSISLPYICYPFILSKILRSRPNTQIKAISIVDNDESFWPDQMGDVILENTPKESIRIFAFKDEKQMRFHIPMLQKHSKVYNVYAISQGKLQDLYRGSIYDFSIIGDINTDNFNMIAKYDRSGFSYKKITFGSQPQDLIRHNDLFKIIIDQSESINNDQELDLMNPRNSLYDTIFHSISRLNNKPVEMSSYISIHEYHKHEEKHAYYIEMMERMLEIYRMRTPISRPKVLEIGSGTGIFTKRLLQTMNIDIMAIEIDWACYNSLLENLRSINTSRVMLQKDKTRNTIKFDSLNATVTCFNEDGRRFNPPGKFDVIFSSFADHHINRKDKVKYFENIKKNLKPDGIFIVGDEFLPNYVENDPIARENALRIYHHHIIDETRKRHGDSAEELVQLEQDALESGIQGLGDFKLSCELYEQAFKNSSMIQVEKHLIGPTDMSNVGGIYVYVIKAAD